MKNTALTRSDARHLLVRTGFAPTQAEVDRWVGKSADFAVNTLLAEAKSARTLNPLPQFVNAPPPIPQAYLKSREEQQAARQQQLREGLELKSWWLREMVETRTPLAERMVLFWHNHFATSQQKVIRSQAMWQQQQVLRANAMGNFSALLHAVAKNPAMLIYLDGANSRKEAPNENFAREVMELFVLGESSQTAAGLGGYTEQDIKEAARAFTGWSVERDDFSFKFRPVFHDNGSKTLLGVTGNLDGDQALDVMLTQPAASRFVVGKLWREFVSPTLSSATESVVEHADWVRASDDFRRSGYDISAALRSLLLCDTFWAEDNRGSLIKSPVDLIVGTVRQFGFTATDVTPLALKSAQLGQNLLVPPNVKGWPGYTDWINATSLLERKRFTEQLFRAVELKDESKTAPLAMPASGMTMEAPQSASMAATNSPKQAMKAEFAGGTQGRGGNQQMLNLLGRDGVLRVAEAMARITFDPERWLETYGGHADREPSDELKAQLEHTLLAVHATHSIAAGTVGVAYLRTLTLDPAYQLK